MSRTNALLFAVASFVVFGAVVVGILASVTDDVGLLSVGPLLVVAGSAYSVYRSARQRPSS